MGLRNLLDVFRKEKSKSVEETEGISGEQGLSPEAREVLLMAKEYADRIAFYNTGLSPQQVERALLKREMLKHGAPCDFLATYL